MKWWIILLSGLGGLGLAVLVVYLALPRWIEGKAEAAALEKGLELEAFPVESIGLKGSRVGPGHLRFGDHHLYWKTLEGEYTLRGLTEGRFGRVVLDHPYLQVAVPDRRDKVAPPAVDPLPVDPLPVDPVPSEPAAARPVPGTEGQPPALPGTVHRQTLPPVHPAAPVRKLVDALPIDEIHISKGQLQVDHPWGGITGLEWSATLLKQDGVLNGWLEAGNNDHATTVRFNADASDETVSLQAGMELDLDSALEVVWNYVREDDWTTALPETDFATPLTLELLLESTPEDPRTGSFEATLASGRVAIPEYSLALQLEQVIAAGSHAQGLSTVKAGLRFGESRFRGITFEPFGLKAHFGSESGIFLETETISLSSDQWTARLALKGKALPAYPDLLAAARLEIAFSDVEGPELNLAPASISIGKSGPDYRLEMSPLGLERNGLLWVEELAVALNPDAATFDGGFTWYNVAGAHMGDVRFDNGSFPDGSLKLDYQLLDPAGTSLLEGDFAYRENSYMFRSSGGLPLKWINALDSWWDLAGVTLSGPDPSFEADLSGPLHYLRGRMILSLGGNGLIASGGISMEGINGSVSLAFMGLPRSTGVQTLRIDRITTGKVTLEEFVARWALPTFRHFQVEELNARMGDGRIRVDPFSFDPTDPEIDAVVRLEHIDGGLFMEWLGETRFRIEGKVSGHVSTGWKDDSPYVAGGSLRMDSAVTENRFIFADADFLKRQFDQMAGIPEELRVPFLDALLQKGILISDLSLEVVPLRESGEVSLRLNLSGETRSEGLVVPIKGLVINNVISERDLGRLFGILGPVRFLPGP